MTISTDIAQQAKKAERELPDTYKEFADVFSQKDTDGLPPSRSFDHTIQLEDSFTPRRAKNYPLNPAETKVCKAFIEEHLKNGRITPSQSPQASPFFFVPKKDGTLRPCQDYRYLNSHTTKNAYPLPLISELVDQLKGSKIFTKFDIRWGYNNILIRPEDRWKAAFSTPFSLYEPTVMFFGLCNSPATFQAYMNHTFQDFIDEGWLIIYMDDMLIHSKDNPTLHRECTKRVLQRLREQRLALKLSKCSFDANEVEYLGLLVSAGAIKMDPTKLLAIKNWNPPRDVKAVRSFIGFCNFYRKFIPGFSDLAKPLLSLTHKNAQWQWSVDHEIAFAKIKEAFLKQLVLAFPDHNKPFFVMTDASLTASGSVLMQKDSNGHLHPCAYFSKTFSPTERNYDIYDRELLAVIHALTEWRQYLTGTTHPVTIITDHKNLTYFKKPQCLSCRQARWQMFLQDYDLEWNHTPGTAMDPADALSRKDEVDTSSDNTEQVLLPDLHINMLDASLASKIAESTPSDQFVIDALSAMEASTVPLPRSSPEDWYFDQGALYYKGRLYVPEPARHSLVKGIHESLAGAHGGYFHTISLLQRDYWWPGMTTFVRRFIAGCAICQANKVNTHPSHPPLAPISSKCTRPFQQISMDLITDLPLSHSYDSVLVVVDHGLLKGVIFSPCNKTTSAADIAEIFFRCIFPRFGLHD